jgi:nicotinamidase-related amidase
MGIALLVIDMQMGMADRIAAGLDCANPKAGDRIADLIALFRGRGLPVIHVLHDDADPASPFRRGQPGGAPMPGAVPGPGEAVFWKQGSSAFAGTGLEPHLRAADIDTIVLVGAVAGFCVTSTTRWASDLGFRVILPGDAVLGFYVTAHDGGRIPAAEVLRVTLSLLGADFARLVVADDVAGLLLAPAHAHAPAPAPA